MADLLFYVLAVLSVGAAVGVVAARNPLFSVLSLLGAFFCLASVFLLLGFQFLAATQLLVYAGAIMVLFLFVVMLLNLADPASYAARPAAIGRGRVAVAALASGAMLLVTVFTVGLRPVEAAGTVGAARGEVVPIPGGIDDVVAIGELLFTRYVIAFEATSLLLLATMIAVILLAKRQRGPEVRGLGWPWQKGVEQ